MTSQLTHGRPPTSSKVTIKDVARLADVSIATVSLALRGSTRITVGTRERVLQIAKDNNYIYNRHAANFRLNKTKTIAVCLNTLGNPVVAGISTSLLRFLQAQGWMVLFGDTQDQPKMQDAFIESVMQYNVAGIIAIPAAGTSPSDLERQAGGTPLVLMLREVPESRVDQIRIDYGSGIRQALDHLLSLGHRRIGWIGGGLETETSRMGLSAYRAGLRANDVEPQTQWIQRCLTSRASGYEAMIQLRRRSPELTAVVCFSDLLASGAVSALVREGVQVGRDMSVIGFDDLDEAPYAVPPLTTVRIDQSLLGEAAGRLLINRIEDADTPRQEMTLPVQLIVRATTGPCVDR